MRKESSKFDLHKMMQVYGSTESRKDVETVRDGWEYERLVYLMMLWITLYGYVGNAFLLILSNSK